MKFTGTIGAWIASTSRASFKDLSHMAESGKGDAAVSALSYSHVDMTFCGWIRVGEATITVDLFSESSVNSAQMTLLKAELKETRANNQQRENDIMDRISNLSALTYEVAS